MLVQRDECIQEESIIALNLVFQYQLMCFFNKMVIWEQQIVSIICFFYYFFPKRRQYISCCHLKFELLLKLNSSLILLQDLTFPLLSNNGRQSLGLCQKDNEKRSTFFQTIENLTKCNKVVWKKQTKSYSNETKYLYKTWEI